MVPFGRKGTILINYKSITGSSIVSKILIALIKEEIYNSLVCPGLFPKEQKGCRTGTRGTNGLQYIDQHIPKDAKMRRKNEVMAWIEFKKLFDMVS